MREDETNDFCSKIFQTNQLYICGSSTCKYNSTWFRIKCQIKSIYDEKIKLRNQMLNTVILNHQCYGYHMWLLYVNIPGYWSAGSKSYHPIHNDPASFHVYFTHVNPNMSNNNSRMLGIILSRGCKGSNTERRDASSPSMHGIQQGNFHRRMWSAEPTMQFNIKKCKVLRLGKINKNRDYVMKRGQSWSM